MSRFEDLLSDACRAAREEFDARSAQAMASNARDRLLAEAWAARPGDVTWASMLRRVNEALPVAGRVRYGTLRKWVRDGSAGVRGRSKGKEGLPQGSGGPGGPAQHVDVGGVRGGGSTSEVRVLAGDPGA